MHFADLSPYITGKHSTFSTPNMQHIPLISRVRGPYDKFLTEFFPSFYGLSAVDFVFFVLLCKLPHMKTKGAMYNVHLNFRGKIFDEKVCIIHR